MIDSQLLIARNKDLIDIVLEKEAQILPHSIDLLGIVGSFQSGDYHEKSDLDLCIVSDDSQTKKLATCFILNDIGYDFYITPWNRLVQMSEYSDPFIAKLFELTPMHIKSEEIWQKYLGLRTHAENKLHNNDENKEKALSAGRDAFLLMQQIQSVDTRGEVFRLLHRLTEKIEYSLYFFNNTYIKKGVRRIPEEIAVMSNKPEGFGDLYESLFRENSIPKLTTTLQVILDYFAKFLNISSAVLTPIKQSTTTNINPKKPISAEQIKGTYEEIYSNWRNKMLLADLTNDYYLSFKTMASCQTFYDEMASEYDVPPIELLSIYDAHNLNNNVSQFDKALAQWETHYIRLNLNIKRFESIESFRSDYLRN
ncbi:MAG: nucleotidyltransferase domain-containing protein [Patescibacteria group bacterium]